jgi:hypothetical protein
MPRPVHAHVRPQHEPARKRDQKLLAAGDHFFRDAAAQRRVVIDAGECGKDGIEAGDRAARKCAVQRPGCTVDAVALRH